MSSPFAIVVAEAGSYLVAQGPGQGDKPIATNLLQNWISSNIVPVLLLVIAIALLWIGGRGDNAGVARRAFGLIVGLIVLGIAVSQKAPEVGKFFAGLITG